LRVPDPPASQRGDSGGDVSGLSEAVRAVLGR
jgi:hypothetical protein